MVVADVNGDGKPDLVVISGCPDINGQGQPAVVSVLLGNGDGTFQSAVTYPSGGVDAVALQVADINGDGIPDLLVANACSTPACPNATLGVLFGNGNGTFQPVIVSAFAGANSLTVADINGDGKPDLILGLGDSIAVMLGNGNGTFQPPVDYSIEGLSALSVALADINGDGKLDAVVAIECNNVFCANGLVGVLLGNGDGTFQPVVTYNSGAQDAISIAVADVSGDGHPDIVVANVLCNNCAGGSVGVLLGNGDGTFQPVVTYNSGAFEALSVAVGVIDGSGIPALVLANCSNFLNNEGVCPSHQGWVSVLLGNGDGTFQGAELYGSGGPEADSVAIANVNSKSNGRNDIVVANFGKNAADGSVGVLLNNTLTSTTTTLVSSLNPSIYGQTVTFTTTVTTTGSMPPTGTVVFQWNDLGETLTLGSATLNASGVATLTKSNLNADTFPLTAVYKGDANNLGSSSAIVNQIVQQTTSAATLTSSPNPSTAGESVSFTATITSSTVMPTGPVTFTAGKTLLGTVELKSGKATLATSSLLVGSNTVTVTYVGDSNIKGSSASVLQIVQ